jgi:hypothetical protein
MVHYRFHSFVLCGSAVTRGSERPRSHREVRVSTEGVQERNKGHNLAICDAVCMVQDHAATTRSQQTGIAPRSDQSRRVRAGLREGSNRQLSVRLL